MANGGAMIEEKGMGGEYMDTETLTWKWLMTWNRSQNQIWLLDK